MDSNTTPKPYKSCGNPGLNNPNNSGKKKNAFALLPQAAIALYLSRALLALSCVPRSGFRPNDFEPVQIIKKYVGKG